MTEDRPVVKTEEPAGVPETEPTDVYQLYDFLSKKFEEAQEKSIELFEREEAQRQTLFYYQRRNNALLNVLGKIEEQREQREQPVPDLARIDSIIAKSPALAPELSKVKALIANDLTSREIPLRKRYLVDLYISETIPELIQDDVTSLEINPSSLKTWACRNYPHLISANFRPINLSGGGISDEYTGVDVNLGFEGTAALESKSKAKRKPTETPTTEKKQKI